jgi:hypothetical protein
MPKEGFIKLSGAMVVNPGFQRGLLDPNTRKDTINGGYLGQPFLLTEAEVASIVAISETKLAEFAEKLRVLQDKAPRAKDLR